MALGAHMRPYSYMYCAPHRDEVYIYPTCFTLYLSVLQCLSWFEAVRGRLIGPKTWDRIVGNFGDFLDCP